MIFITPGLEPTYKKMRKACDNIWNSTLYLVLNFLSLHDCSDYTKYIDRDNRSFSWKELLDVHDDTRKLIFLAYVLFDNSPLPEIKIMGQITSVTLFYCLDINDEKLKEIELEAFKIRMLGDKFKDDPKVIKSLDDVLTCREAASVMKVKQGVIKCLITQGIFKGETRRTGIVDETGKFDPEVKGTGTHLIARYAVERVKKEREEKVQKRKKYIANDE